MRTTVVGDYFATAICQRVEEAAEGPVDWCAVAKVKQSSQRCTGNYFMAKIWRELEQESRTLAALESTVHTCASKEISEKAVYRGCAPGAPCHFGQEWRRAGAKSSWCSSSE